jgi:catechol 2,3-dioxygenase-like lactoylglutathione lyase family enzyme
MAKVLGIGGVFFKAQDPQAVRDWYARVLGLVLSEWGGAMFPHPAVGQTNWAVFPADSDYYAPSTAPFMVNFIVDDLDAVLARAQAEGAEPVGEPISEAYGKFGWLMDPAGVKIELWQPPADPPTT